VHNYDPFIVQMSKTVCNVYFLTNTMFLNFL